MLQRAEGAGKTLASALTAADGTFSLSISLKTPESLVAIAPAAGATSLAIDVKLRPRLAARVGKAAAFAEATVSITVDPHGATGKANITVKRNGKTVQRTQAKVRKGRASQTIVAPGPGAYTVIVDFDAPNGYAAASATAPARATTRILRVGSKGSDVAGLIRKLRSLNFHVPPPSQSYTTSVRDAVIAFQKVSGLRRTGAMGQTDWKTLAKLKPVQATRKGSPNRIEVDKTRQILIKVRKGKVMGVLHTSTGRTGNTPEGVHKIRWKAPQTSTWLGPGLLYRTLTFWGNSFAIHGWKSVPTSPASSGCVRIPMWAADWLYDRSPVGETVIVHR